VEGQVLDMMGLLEQVSAVFLPLVTHSTDQEGESIQLFTCTQKRAPC
jgi:hypothetical protein